MEKGRIVFVLVLVTAGAGLLAYGLFHNSITVWSKSPAPPEIPVVEGEPSMTPEIPALDGEPSVTPVAAQSEIASEPAVVQEVARGGVTRDESGQIKKTYEGTDAPKACPT